VGSGGTSAPLDDNTKMKIFNDLTMMSLPTQEPKAPAWARDAGFLADKVVLHGGMYARLFGRTL
jgi:hypothetical protein